ncbi:MAG: hypothetical protein ABFS86_15260 [Planctomycetota bacterium]
MKILGLFVLVAAVLAFTLPVLFLDADLGTATVLAKDKEDKKDKDKDDDKDDDEEKKDSGSKFDDDDDEKEDGKKEDKIPDKPVKKTYAFADYRLEFTIEDSRFWKHDRNYSDEDTKAGICLKMLMKRPKSDDHFDVRIRCQGFEHGGNVKIGEATVGSSNIKGLADASFERDMESWKETKDITKPKGIKMNRVLGKVYHYGFTGMAPGNSYPLHVSMYYMKYKSKTYIMSVLFTTTSWKNKGIREAVDKLLKSFKAKKKTKKKR